MATKYILVRVRKEDYMKLKLKKNLLKKDMDTLSGTNIKFSFPQFFSAVANGIIEIEPEHAINLFKIRRVKND